MSFSPYKTAHTKKASSFCFQYFLFKFQTSVDRLRWDVLRADDDSDVVYDLQRERHLRRRQPERSRRT
jgi:hypothetical protein